MEFEKEPIQWIEYDLLASFPHLYQATFLRHGGTSSGAFVSLNVSESVGDHPDCVKVNRDIIRKKTGTPHLIFAKQTHGIDIKEVTKSNRDKIFTCDGLITREKGIALAVTHADCQAAIFFDKKQEVVAVIHAGWKGLVQNIYSACIQLFTTQYHSKVENILVAISFGLGPEHAEFKNYKEEFPKNLWSYRQDNNLFDLRAIGKDQLKACGLKDSQIEVSPLCSFCNPKDCYSYRRDHITGRHATVAALI